MLNNLPSPDLLKAKELLHSSNFTCVLVKDLCVYTSYESGISPMLNLLENNVDVEGFCVADKIVGKAAAFLFAKAKVRQVFAQVLSETALPVLEKFGIEYFFDTLTPAIINRTQTDICPMEKVVENIEEIEAAFEAVLKLRNELRAKSNSK